MGNIVAVSCSPRENDTSSVIADAFLDGAMGLSTNIITLHNLVKFMALLDCRRCMACKNTGKCRINDDLQQVLADISNADCVVFATPIFLGSPVGLYKLLEDRMYSFLDKEGKSVLAPGKKAIIILTSYTEDEDLSGAAEIMSKNLAALGFELMDVITSCDVREIDPALLHRAKELGRTLRNTPTV
jgi:multimeric flavodoxin WrbA